jgi:hypothetical protein
MDSDDYGRIDRMYIFRNANAIQGDYREIKECVVPVLN